LEAQNKVLSPPMDERHCDVVNADCRSNIYIRK